MATSFKERIAMDLKFYKGRILLHLIDHATRHQYQVLSNQKNHKSYLKLFSNHGYRYTVHLKNS